MIGQVSADSIGSAIQSSRLADAARVTLRASLIAQLLIVLIGTPAAYLLGTQRFRGRSLALTVVELPIILPPAVAGIALIVTFGRTGAIGSPLDRLGIHIGVGTSAAVVLVLLFVAGPFYVRQAVASFESVDQQLLDAARTLGASPSRVFFRIAVPLAVPGLAAGFALSLARGLGEFGATLMFAGSLQGVTQTMSLAIYSELGLDVDTALAFAVLLAAASILLLILVKIAARRVPILISMRRNTAS
jgi:molybdate transport system permease protein